MNSAAIAARIAGSVTRRRSATQGLLSPSRLDLGPRGAEPGSENPSDKCWAGVVTTVRRGPVGTEYVAGLLALLLLVAACGGGAPAAETPEPAGFSVAAVRQSFTEECADPIILDELFCEQVDLAGLSADGTILNVPTGLNAAARDRAGAICDLFVLMHFDANAVDLGYEIVGILDQNGGNLAACTVD